MSRAAAVLIEHAAAIRALAERVASRIKKLQPKVSNRQIAKVLGVNRSTVDRDTGPNGPPADKKTNKVNTDKAALGPNGPPVFAGAAAAKLVARKENTVDRRDEERCRSPPDKSETCFALAAALIPLAVNGEFTLYERKDCSTAQWRSLKLVREPRNTGKKKLVARLERRAACSQHGHYEAGQASPWHPAVGDRQLRARIEVQ